MTFASAACSLERSLGDYFTSFVAERSIQQQQQGSSISATPTTPFPSPSPKDEAVTSPTATPNTKGRAKRERNSNNKENTAPGGKEPSSGVPVCPRILRDLLLTPELTQLLGADVVLFPPPFFLPPPPPFLLLSSLLFSLLSSLSSLLCNSCPLTFSRSLTLLLKYYQTFKSYSCYKQQLDLP